MITLRAFRDETSLARWLGKSTISITDMSDTDIIIKIPILINYNIAARRNKLLKAYSEKYPKDETPILAEIDHIYIEKILYPNNDNTDTGHFFAHNGEFYPVAVEIKYFRVKKAKSRKMNEPYYAGLGQTLATLKFGFYRTHLWHFFDHEVPKDIATKYVKHMKDLLEQTNLPLPIFYRYCFLEKGDEKKEFGFHRLKDEYSSYNVNYVNPYYENEKAAFIRQFIVKDVMGASFTSNSTQNTV